jgi:hypothetical protein
LRNAIAKYGKDNFQFEVVEGASSKEELDSLEIRWVATSLFPVGYNLKSGGAAGRPSEDTKRKISNSGVVAQNRPEVKARNSSSVKTAMAKPDVKARHKRATKIAFNSTVERERRKARALIQHSDPEIREKTRVALKAAWSKYSEEEREERIKRQKAGISAEVRLKMARRRLPRETLESWHARLERLDRSDNGLERPTSEP